MATKKKSIKKKEDAPYALTLKLGDAVFHSSGNTLLEALSGLEEPPKVFLKGALTITANGNTRDVLLMPAKVKRLFMKMSRQVVAKQLGYGL